VSELQKGEHASKHAVCVSAREQAKLDKHACKYIEAAFAHEVESSLPKS